MKIYSKNTDSFHLSENKQRVRGISFITAFLVVAAMVTGIAISMAKFQQSSLASTNSNISVLQAYQFAESELDVLTLRGYKNLAAQVKTTISDTKYQGS